MQTISSEYEAFYRRNVDSVQRFAARRCARPEDAADLVSSTFLEALRGFASYDPSRGAERPWLLGIASRCLADQWRDAYRQAVPAVDAPVTVEDDVVARVDATRLSEPLARGLRRLTPAERDVLLLVADDVPVAEAGRALGIPAPAARMRLRRARMKLVAFLAVAAAVVVAVVIARPSASPPASAAEFLRRAAAAVRDSPSQYFYVRYRALDGTVTEQWTRADGSGRVRAVLAGRVVDDSRVKAHGPAPVPVDGNFDPVQMRAFAAYRVLQDTLGRPATAGARARALRVLAATPGIRLAGHTVIVRVGDVALRTTIDPASGRVTAIERDLLRRSTQLPGPPRVVNRAVVEASGPVESVHERR